MERAAALYKCGYIEVKFVENPSKTFKCYFKGITITKEPFTLFGSRIFPKIEN